jgi:hypothetical protein
MIWPRTTIKATTAAGGCRERNKNISKIGRLAFNDIANKDPPINEEMVLPSIIAQA